MTSVLSQTSDVGPLELPHPAGVLKAKLEDPIIETLIDFIAFYLNNDISPKLALLPGTSSVAVPSANKFTFDPLEPRGQRVRRPVPSLFLWWDGNSTRWQYSQLQGGRIRNLNLLYIFDELPALAEMDRRSGLMNAVAASIEKAAEREYHPLYAPNGKPLGTEMSNSIGDLAMWEWSYLGGRGVQRIGIDDQGRGTDIARPAGRHYPGFAAQLMVRELIQPPQPVDPAGVTQDSLMTIENDGVEIMQRVLDAPDGEEAPENF